MKAQSKQPTNSFSFFFLWYEKKLKSYLTVTLILCSIERNDKKKKKGNKKKGSKNDIDNKKKLIFDNKKIDFQALGLTSQTYAELIFD